MPIDPQGSIALLIGISAFPKDPKNFPDLLEVQHNVDDLQKVLLDEKIVGFTDVRPLVNENSDVIGHAVMKAAEAAEDTLFLYYAGHGIVKSGHFYLTGSNSIEEAIAFSGIKFETLSQAINRSPARRKILILDSCFSGRAIQDMASGSGIIEANIDELEGGFTLASAGKSQTAPAISPSGRYTGFTDVLLTVLREGLEPAKEWISLQEFCDEVKKGASRRPGLPKPVSRFTEEIAGSSCFETRNTRR
ncbi:MAG: caspase domain-containing protein [Gammaproteobacteria bacterium]